MNDAGIQDHDVLQLVRASDPLTSPLSVPCHPADDLLHQILSAERSPTPIEHGTPIRRRRALIATATLVVAAGGGASTAYATGLIGGSGGIQAARIFASTTGIASVHTVAASQTGHASIAEGVKDGATVAAATIGDSTMPFVPLKTLLDGREMAVQTGSGGAQGSVDWIAAAGVVSDRVARVEIEGGSGTLQPVALASNAFAVDLDPSFKPTAVIAYGLDGKTIERIAVPVEQAP